MKPEINFSLISESDATESPGTFLTIQTSMCERNVWMTREDLQMLPSVREARWDNRSSIKIGTSAGAPVFWSCDDQALAVLVGTDDETWEYWSVVA